MSKNIIFYFTGTGNSLKVAKDIALGIGDCALVSMGKPYDMNNTYEYIGFVYPVYFAGMPGVVERFIKALDLSKNINTFIFAISTSGALKGGLPNASKIIVGKGATLNYGTNIKCFSNYICMYKMADDKTKQAKAKAQENATELVLKDIKNKSIKQNFKNSFLAFKHNGFVKSCADKDKAFSINSNCNGCGTCAKVCPVGNIKMQNSKPSFEHRCEQCMACIQWCPKQAINIGKKTQNRGRYHHPSITVEDIAGKKYYTSVLALGSAQQDKTE